MKTASLDAITITCGDCGAVAPVEDFTRTIFGELPPNVIQCPSCRKAWCRTMIRDWRPTGSGRFTPPVYAMIPTQPEL